MKNGDEKIRVPAMIVARKLVIVLSQAVDFDHGWELLRKEVKCRSGVVGGQFHFLAFFRLQVFFEEAHRLRRRRYVFVLLDARVRAGVAQKLHH